MKRRWILRTLGWAATAASVGYTLNADEPARVDVSSTRLLEVLRQDHVDLQPQRHTPAVRTRDERLSTHGLMPT